MTNQMAERIPFQCAYMYMPEAMFDVSKDEQIIFHLHNKLNIKQQKKIANMIDEKEKTKDTIFSKFFMIKT